MIGIPAFIGLGLAFISNKIISKEEALKNRELELKIQLDAEFIQTV